MPLTLLHYFYVTISSEYQTRQDANGLFAVYFMLFPLQDDVESFYMKAVSMFAAMLGSTHEKTLSSKVCGRLCRSCADLSHYAMLWRSCSRRSTASSCQLSQNIERFVCVWVGMGEAL